MICEIYDDKFDAKYLHELYDLVQNKLRYRASNVANSHTWPYHQQGSHRLFGSTIFSRSHPNFIDYVDNVHAKNFYSMFEFLCELINVNTRNVYLKRIDVNLQHSGCDGSLHIDSEGPTDKSGHTIMVMPNPVWKDEWGGKFQIFNEDNTEMLEEYDYVPGRIIIFPSHLPHRGLGPKEPHLYRYSIVFGVVF